MGRKKFSQVVESLFLAILLCGALTQVGCFNFSSFPVQTDKELILSKHSRLFFDAIQVTPDVLGENLANFSGRVFYKKPFRLWSKSKGVTASFNTTFVLRINPVTSPGGEGLAFILTADTTLPEASQGQWLGIVNASTNGSSQAEVVAIEFDTRKSYPEDLDENHVGLDVNSIYSIKQVSLTGFGVDLSSNSDVRARVEYDGKTKSVVVSISNATGELKPVISLPLNLSDHLPERVSVGFSASTGIYTELNCIRSWEFSVEDIGDENPERLWIWITVPAVVLVLIGILVYLYLQRKRRERPEDAYPRIEDQIEGSSVGPRKFKLKDLRKATGNFNPRNKLGKGGFGTVYKGFLANKLEVAVKRVSKDSSQGKQEFIAEVTTIGSLHHKNLVKLIGWCYERRELLLVYEFMPNGSLDKFIYGDENLGMEEQNLSWEKRHIIIYGVAQALDYLHNGCAKRVLHRDIKASNIMLDSDFNARLGDFGLARTVQQSGKTHHTTKEIAGTPGYMAPETFLVGRATVETDIYAFGVLVLEVVCGRKPGKQNEDNDYNNGIVYWLWELHRREGILDAVDPRLDGKFDEEGMKRMLVLGLACCHPNPHHRPSMKTVLQVIIGEAPLPPVPNERPAFVWPAMPPSFKQDADDVSLIGSQLSPFTQLAGR
ncbi:probable L-type lectin-domain containing receptor kinase S.5 [Juglans microcarpa x Juglans regia]|uniref:probable L-type lectin-domain containing receptor kinase S.5 n=1 Tax=Juglans microcarpa x Juglans regia TaxID=2249226 RepID=UPI001B7F2A99|nr:probable L-type lectin-domain containing receptor kinase S.5 [Juglans microcarpa x Juglans regia]